MDSWLNYLKEEENKEAILNEHGFGLYTIIGNEFFVTDLHVDKEFRDKGFGLDLANKLYKTAKESNCECMTCNIFVDTHNRERAPRKIFLFSKFGFEIVSANSNVITMKKEL